MDFIDGKAIGVFGRKNNGLILEYDKSILITADILKHSEDESEPHISIAAVEEKIDMFAKRILLESKGSNRDAESVVYGESLVELLKWMIEVMKTHSHPPNAPAIPNFHKEANERKASMDRVLLNKRIQTR